MKQLLSIFYIFVLINCSDIPKNIDKQINISGKAWHINIKSALALAKKNKKNLLIMVSEDYCRWCLKMEKETLTTLSIQKKLENYILVSIKRSDKKSLKYIPDFDGNIPSFFFIEHDSDFIESIIGYYEPSIFLEYIQEIENDRE